MKKHEEFLQRWYYGNISELVLCAENEIIGAIDNFIKHNVDFAEKSESMKRDAIKKFKSLEKNNKSYLFCIDGFGNTFFKSFYENVVNCETFIIRFKKCFFVHELYFTGY